MSYTVRLSFLLLLPALASIALSEPVSPVDVFSELLPIKNKTGNLTVIGRDRRECLDLVRWSDTILEKVESVLQSRMLFHSRKIYISIRDTENDPDVSTSLELSGKGLLQRIIILDYDKVDVLAVQDAYCRVLLSGTALQLSKTTGFNRETVDPQMPRWLWSGVSQNLDRNRRSRNCDLVLEKWKKGEIPSLAGILKKKEKDTIYYNNDLALDNAVSGMIVSWIVSMRKGKNAIYDVLAACGNGKHISIEWIAANFKEIRDITAAEDSWDKWLLKQHSIVYVPGRLSKRVVDQLKSELLLYPGVSGIPLSGDLNGSISFSGLIRRSDEKWIPALVADKTVRLRLLGIGRGEDFDKTIDLYCRFLNALRDGKDAKTLNALLGKAERSLASIEDNRAIKE